MYTFKDNIILTGAGFSADFGGFLAKEMWSKIFNNPKLNDAPKIKQELKKDFDFEKIYSRIVPNSSAFNPDEVKAFETALNDAYKIMDDDIKQVDWFDRAGIFPQPFTKFLSFFTDYTEEKVGSYFTLNQDLFPERHLDWTPLGFQKTEYKSNQSAPEMMLPSDDEITQFDQASKDQFLYVKLHGSTNWISDRGKDIKIVGINKKETLEKIPLLNWYFKIFEAAIYRENVRLLIIGYGFNDEHINNCLIKAIQNYKLKLYVITPTPPKKFSFTMTHKYPEGSSLNDLDEPKKAIWEAIEGYFPYRLSAIFSRSQAESARRTELYESLGISSA